MFLQVLGIWDPLSLQGLIKQGVANQNIHAFMHSENSMKVAHDLNIQSFSDWGNLPEDTDVLVLAVKPKDISHVCRLIAPHLPEGCAVVSVAAGVCVDAISTAIQSNNIIRCMPNTPIAVGQGVCGLYAHVDVPEIMKNGIEDMFKPLAYTFWLNFEDQLHAVTALSGSGPAYFFYFMESMMEQAEKWQIPRDIARNIILNTVIGSTKLAQSYDDNVSFNTLKENVTSKGGTTAAALDDLQKYHVSREFKHALEAAYDRSLQLEGSTK